MGQIITIWLLVMAKMVTYGMEIKTFHESHILSAINGVRWTNPRNIPDKIKKKYGDQVRHGILMCPYPLDSNICFEYGLREIDVSSIK